MQYPVLALVTALALSSTPAAADLKAGLDAFAAKDYPRALAEFEQAGQSGDVWGWFYLANMYVDGTGVAQDLKRAAGFYQTAAEGGHVGAQLRLGNMYRRGYGVERDWARAIRWLGRALEGGSAEAAFYIGDMFAEGDGEAFEASDREAADYYDIAANEGLPHAMAKLGLMIRDGRGRPADRVEALKWLTLAAEFTEGEVKDEVEKQRRRLVEQMTPAEIAAGEARAAAWQPWER